jgi:hypothetical protein
VLFALSDVIDEQNVNCEALIRHMMCMYEGIVGVNAAGQLDNIGEIDTLSKGDLSELQRDLTPLISIIKNEDPYSRKQQVSPLKPPSSTSKGIQVAPSSEDMLAQLRHNVEKLKEIAPLNSTQPLVELQLQYEFGLKLLEKKLVAYKTEFQVQRSLSKRQERCIAEYEHVFLSMMRQSQKGSPP